MKQIRKDYIKGYITKENYDNELQDIIRDIKDNL